MPYQSNIATAHRGRSGSLYAGVYTRCWLTICLAAASMLTLSCAHESKQDRDPGLSMVHYRLGSDYFGKKMPRQAKVELLRALELDETNQRANYLLGVLFFVEGVHAANYIDRAQCLRGTAAEEQRRTVNERLRDAHKYLTKAVELAEQQKQKESEALNYLANIAIHFERYDEAIRMCSSALKNVLYAQQHLALGNRGWARFKKGDLEGAGRDLRQALYHRPDACLAHFRLAKVYFALKEYAKVIDQLARKEGSKDCPIQESFKLLGLAYVKRGQPERARKQFSHCVAMNPRSCVSQECRRYARLL